MKAHAAPATRDCILRLRAPNLKRWGPADSAAMCHSSQGAVHTTACQWGLRTLDRAMEQTAEHVRPPCHAPSLACMRGSRRPRSGAHELVAFCRPAHIALSCQLGAARASSSATRAHPLQRLFIKGIPDSPRHHWSSAGSVIVATWFASIGCTYHSSHEAQ